MVMVVVLKSTVLVQGQGGVVGPVQLIGGTQGGTIVIVDV